MALGARNRSVAETKMNERSSRSHSVLSVIVDGLTHATQERSHGCLHLIDLAGMTQAAPVWGCTVQVPSAQVFSHGCRLRSTCARIP